MIFENSLCDSAAFLCIIFDFQRVGKTIFEYARTPWVGAWLHILLILRFYISVHNMFPVLTYILVWFSFLLNLWIEFGRGKFCAFYIIVAVFKSTKAWNKKRTKSLFFYHFVCTTKCNFLLNLCVKSSIHILNQNILSTITATFLMFEN